MLELEKTYLLKFVPPGLFERPCEEMVDLYIPASVDHPVLRLRKKGKQLEMTKKQPRAGDTSEQTEETIALSSQEYDALKDLPGKRVTKRRYKYKGAEIDIFTEKLSGLALADFEFSTTAEKEQFSPPDFCLAEVTHLEAIAGGNLAGESFETVYPQLEQFGYSPIHISNSDV